jgi:hypothetical protein
MPAMEISYELTEKDFSEALVVHRNRNTLSKWSRRILWTMRRQFRKQPGAHGPRKVLLDSSGAHWRWNGGSADVEWKNYIRSVEGRNQILFYTSPACFNIVPKRALETEQLSEVREMLKQNIHAK